MSKSKPQAKRKFLLQNIIYKSRKYSSEKMGDIFLSIKMAESAIHSPWKEKTVCEVFSLYEGHTLFLCLPVSSGMVIIHTQVACKMKHATSTSTDQPW